MAKKQFKPPDQPIFKPAEPAVVPANKFSLLDFKVQAFILAIVGLVFYFNTFSNENAFDDMMAIVDNEYVQQGVSGIPAILTTDAYQSYLEHKGSGNQLAGGRYRPLSLITFAIEQQVIGVANDQTGNARDARTAEEMHSRHVVNVLLYIISIIALLYLFRYAVFPAAPVAAFVAALLFIILPVHTEVVTNVKSRDEILSLLFITLTFIKAFRYYDNREKNDLVLALVFYFLALLSKEYAATLVAFIPLSFFIFRKETWAKSVTLTLPYLIPLALYLALRFNAVSAAAEGAEQNVLNNPYLFATSAQKLATELLVMLYYIKLLAFPNVLVADYSYNQIPYTDFSNPLVLLSAVLYLSFAVATVVLVMRRNYLGFALAFYLVNLLLISNLFFNIGAPMGERLIYHSSVGFCIIVAALLWLVYQRLPKPAGNGVLGGVMLVLVLLCGAKTMARNQDWKNSTTLFLTDVKTSPNSVLVNNNAAAACMTMAKKNKQDVPVRNEWLQKAIGYFNKAQAIYPKYVQSYINKGLCYYNMGKPDSALVSWDTARKYSPADPSLVKYMNEAGKYFFAQGRNYQSKGMNDSAIGAFSKSIDAMPGVPDAWYGLGITYASTGRKDDARDALEKAAQLAPTNPAIQQAYNQMKEAK